MVVVMIFGVWNGAVLCVFVIAPPAEEIENLNELEDDILPYDKEILMFSVSG